MDEETRRSHVYLSHRKRKIRTPGSLKRADDAMHILEPFSDFLYGIDELPCHHLQSPRRGRSLKWRRKPSFTRWMQIVLYISTTLLGLSKAAFVTFENCMSPNIIGSDPRQLQFRPLFVRAFFNTTAASHNLNVTVYGNVSGSATNEPLPRVGDPHWDNPNETLGKIPEIDTSNNKYTTLKAALKVLDYTPYTADPLPFCSRLTQGQCPLGPSFSANG